MVSDPPFLTVKYGMFCVSEQVRDAVIVYKLVILILLKAKFAPLPWLVEYILIPLILIAY